MLLVDGGCEYKLYASDVTRAYPIGGKFEGDYKTLYEIVLECQLEVIGMIKAGVQYEELHRCALEGICKGLVKVWICCSYFFRRVY
jgi:Xaa-Pro aminopeptidase